MNQLKDKTFSQLQNQFVEVATETEDPISSLPQINQEAFFGVLRKFIDATDGASEASPVAIAANVIAMFAAILGRSIYQWIGDSKIHCRPFFLLVGKSGKARKGTSEALPRRVFERVDEILREKNPNHVSLNTHTGGLASGEGIAFAIRDASDEDESDVGVPDKRLLVIEPEFANVLSCCKRETSTLSAVIRNVFDGRDLAPLTKRNRIYATKPHVVIVGHITGHELKDKVLKGVEATNGLLNRFLMCYVAREKLVPLPETTSRETIDILSYEIVNILEFVETMKVTSGGDVEVCFNDQAKVYWVNIYSKLSQDNPGVIGSLLARSEVYARMLSMIFAIFDQKTVIEICHIQAAIRWVAFVEASAWHLFGNIKEQVNEEKKCDFAEEIFLWLKENGDMSRSDINKFFNGHKSQSDIKEALEYLLNQTPVRILQTKVATKGRPKEIYAAK